MTRVLRVTLDTGALGPVELTKIESAIEGRDVELAHTSVTDREQSGTSYASAPAAIAETMVWGESSWDGSVWGHDESAARFEAILDVIADGGFPAPERRDSLSDGHRHQLRDAMILDAHAREGRDVFVTNDVTHLIAHGRRERLEALCSTQIVTVDELLDCLARRAGGASLPA